MSFVDGIIRRRTGQRQCGRGQIRISQKNKAGHWQMKPRRMMVISSGRFQREIHIYKYIYISPVKLRSWFFSTSLCQAAENILSLLLGGSSESPRVLLSSGGGGGGLGASVSGVTWAFSPPHRGRVFSGGPDNAVEPLNSFVWLASIQACEPRPTQSAAIVTVRMLQQLCDRLQCYTAALSSSPAPLLCLSLYFHFFFLCEDPVILSQAWWLSSVPRPSFIFLIFCSSSSLPLSAMPYYSLSSSPARFSFFFFLMWLSRNHLLLIF